MAKAPTVVPYGYASHTVGNVTNISTGIDYAVATLASTQKGIAAVLTVITATKGDILSAYFTANARLS
jgi:hypothetical protein